jgi:hypothetical protein
MKGGVWCPSVDFRETFIDSLVLGDLDRFAAHACDTLGCGTEWYLIKEKTSRRHKQADHLVALLIDRRHVTVELVRNALRDSHNETLLSKFDSENSTKAMEGFNYGNFKHELRGVLATRVIETLCDALPNMTDVLVEKILDQRNTNALISFLENHGYMGETRGVSKLAAFCSQHRGLATVAELCETFCPTATQKNLNERKGDIMEFNVTDDSLMLFAREHQNIIYSSWTDLKNHFEVSRAKRGVKSSQSIQWIDLDRLGPAERAVRLFADAHALGQLDMLVEVLSRRQVPLHRVFVSTFGTRDTSPAMIDISPVKLCTVYALLDDGNSWEAVASELGYSDTDRMIWRKSKDPTEMVLRSHYAKTGKRISVNAFVRILQKKLDE